MEKIKKIILGNKELKETLWAFWTKFYVFLAFYVIQIFLARNMPLEQWGKWSGFISLLNIILLCSNLGQEVSTKKFIAQYKNTDKIKSIIRSSMLLRIVSSIIFALAVLCFYKWLLNALDKKQYNDLFLISIPLVFLFGMVEYFKSIFEGFHNIRHNFIVNFLEYTFKLIFVLILFSMFKSLSSIVISFSMASGFAIAGGFLVLYFFYYRRIKQDSKTNFTKSIFKYSIPLFITSVAAFISMEIDIVMLSVISGDRSAGIYSIAKQIVHYLPHITFAIGMGVMPSFANITKDNVRKLRQTFKRALCINILIFLFAIILILASGWFFVPMVFGFKYYLSVKPLLLLTPYLFFVTNAMFCGMLLDYQGKAVIRTINFLFTFVANVVLNFILIPRYGASGAAIATSVSFLPYFILNGFFSFKVLYSHKQAD